MRLKGINKLMTRGVMRQCMMFMESEMLISNAGKLLVIVVACTGCAKYTDAWVERGETIDATTEHGNGTLQLLEVSVDDATV